MGHTHPGVEPRGSYRSDQDAHAPRNRGKGREVHEPSVRNTQTRQRSTLGWVPTWEPRGSVAYLSPYRQPSVSARIIFCLRVSGV